MEQGQRHIGRLIKQVNEALERQINNEMRPRGVTMQQMQVLIELHRSESGELDFKQLERLLGCAQSTMWGLISRLEQKGLVESCSNPERARAKMVRLTEQGRQLCETAYGEMLAHERQLTSRLSAEEASQLRDLLERVYASIAEQG